MKEEAYYAKEARRTIREGRINQENKYPLMGSQALAKDVYARGLGTDKVFVMPERIEKKYEGQISSKGAEMLRKQRERIRGESKL